MVMYSTVASLVLGLCLIDKDYYKSKVLLSCLYYVIISIILYKIKILF